MFLPTPNTTCVSVQFGRGVPFYCRWTEEDCCVLCAKPERRCKGTVCVSCLSLGQNDALISPVTHTLLTHKHTLIKTYTGTPHVLHRQTDRRPVVCLAQARRPPASVRQNERERGHLLFRFRTSRLSYFGSGGLLGEGAFSATPPPAARRLQRFKLMTNKIVAPHPSHVGHPLAELSLS